MGSRMYWFIAFDRTYWSSCRVWTFVWSDNSNHEILTRKWLLNLGEKKATFFTSQVRVLQIELDVDFLASQGIPLDKVQRQFHIDYKIYERLALHGLQINSWMDTYSKGSGLKGVGFPHSSGNMSRVAWGNEMSSKSCWTIHNLDTWYLISTVSLTLFMILWPSAEISGYIT